MPKQKKTWILVKGYEYRPKGILSLGQILTKPFEPSLPLLSDSPLAIPETSIERSYQASVELASNTTLASSFKIWADVSMLPVSGKVGANFHTSESLLWHFDRLETEIIVPRLSDIQTAISKDEVIAQINRKNFDFRKRLYMITGVRIARGARLVQFVSQGVGGGAKLGVDLTALTGAPVSLGPAVEGSKTLKSDFSFSHSSDFVYAYRVCEIHYGKDVYTKPYNSGDTFGLKNGNEPNEFEVSSEDEEEKEEDQRVVVEKIDEKEYMGSDVPHQNFVLEGDNGDEELILSDV